MSTRESAGHRWKGTWLESSGAMSLGMGCCEERCKNEVTEPQQKGWVAGKNTGKLWCPDHARFKPIYEREKP